MKKTELLVPVGNMECLYAAIHNGADAVYLGGKKYGARAYSNNFSLEEMKSAIKLCHLYGVKIYVTVNTMIFNDEIEDLMEYIEFLYINGVDALIMQDNGLIKLVRDNFQDLEVHVSTQAHNHNEYGINYYKEIGCTRVVFDRESSLEEIINIDVDIEKEVFVYGALCVCYSGNCLFSALNGNRSANRGMCVGSCRLPYKLYKNDLLVDDGYLLSTKDLNTLDFLNKILDAKIDSLKIEGRMKSKEYVAVITRLYRRLIDDYYAGKELFILDSEKEELLKTFNRTFTKGYLFGETNIINKKTSNHQGVLIGEVISVNNKKITIKLSDDIHQEDAIRFDKTGTGMYLNTLYDQKGLLVSSVAKGNVCVVDNKDRIMVKDLLGSKVLKTIDYLLNKKINDIEEKKIQIRMIFKATLNSPIKLIVSDGENNVEIEGSIALKANNRPVDYETVNKHLCKLGGTPFKLADIDIELDEGLFINIKDLNEIRRNAIDCLIQKRGISKNRVSKGYKLKKFVNSANTKRKISILVRNEEQLRVALKNNIDYIYVTREDLYFKYKSYESVYLRLDRVIYDFNEYSGERLLCTEFGSVNCYGKNNKVRSDYYLNVANDYTLRLLSELGVEGVTLSVELDVARLCDIKGKENAEILVYGKPECMIIKNNIFNIDGESTYLVNKFSEKFKVTYDNYTHIFNHKNIDLRKSLNKLKGFGTYRIELLDEGVKEVQEIIDSIK